MNKEQALAREEKRKRTTIFNQDLTLDSVLGLPVKCGCLSCLCNRCEKYERCVQCPEDRCRGVYYAYVASCVVFKGGKVKCR